MWALAVLLVNCLLVQGREYYRYNLDAAEYHFEEFIQTYNRTYDEYERANRFEIFKENLKNINKMNEESEHAVFDVNQFSDLTKDEFRRYYTGLRGWNGERFGMGACTADVSTSAKAPESFDWRSRNVVSRVKNQMGCGSCWAFGTTGAVESQYAIKNKKNLEISEQQLVDCDKKSQGCDGTRDLQFPYSYLIAQGAMSEKDYPYTANEGECKYDADKVKVKVTNCRSPDLNRDEEKLKNILYQYGPATMAVDSAAVQSYSSGIIKGKTCKSDTIDHAVLLVGYGSDNGTPYWIIKNSWTERFGEEGFFRIERGVNCLNMMIAGSIQPVLE